MLFKYVACAGKAFRGLRGKLLKPDRVQIMCHKEEGEPRQKWEGTFLDLNVIQITKHDGDCSGTVCQ